MLTKGHILLNKPGSLSWRFAISMYELLLPPGVKGLKFLSNSQTLLEVSHQLCSLKKLFWKFSRNFKKIIYDRVHIGSSTMLNMSSVADVFLGIRKGSKTPEEKHLKLTDYLNQI